MTAVKPFPTDRAGKSQLWQQMQQRMPSLAPLMNTLKDQGITSKVVMWTDESQTVSDEVPTKPEQLYQIDDALVERVRMATEVAHWTAVEAARKEKQRIEARKRKLK